MSQDEVNDAPARHVLLCLANYAGADGAAAFPSVATLSADTGLAERTIQNKLALLEELGVIVRGNQAIVAAYIDRPDRRPVVYDIKMRGEPRAPRYKRGASHDTNGVHLTTERGAPRAPNPSYNHPSNPKAPHTPQGGGAGVVDPADLFGGGKPSAEAVDDLFNQFWSAYPRKVGKDAARKAFDKRKPKAGLVAAMLVALTAAKGSRDWAREGGRFIPNPSTWINQGRWQDDVVSAPVADRWQVNGQDHNDAPFGAGANGSQA